jgi:predicted RNA-binding Zn-ribbon protein involved in translation (DUF1610 family)
MKCQHCNKAVKPIKDTDEEFIVWWCPECGKVVKIKMRKDIEEKRN